MNWILKKGEIVVKIPKNHDSTIMLGGGISLFRPQKNGKTLGNDFENRNQWAVIHDAYDKSLIGKSIFFFHHLLSTPINVSGLDTSETYYKGTEEFILYFTNGQPHKHWVIVEKCMKPKVSSEGVFLYHVNPFFRQNYKATSSAIEGVEEGDIIFSMATAYTFRAINKEVTLLKTSHILYNLTRDKKVNKDYHKLVNVAVNPIDKHFEGDSATEGIRVIFAPKNQNVVEVNPETNTESNTMITASDNIICSREFVDHLYRPIEESPLYNHHLFSAKKTKSKIHK